MSPLSATSLECNRRVSNHVTSPPPPLRSVDSGIGVPALDSSDVWVGQRLRSRPTSYLTRPSGFHIQPIHIGLSPSQAAHLFVTLHHRCSSKLRSYYGGDCPEGQEKKSVAGSSSGDGPERKALTTAGRVATHAADSTGRWHLGGFGFLVMKRVAIPDGGWYLVASFCGWKSV